MAEFPKLQSLNAMSIEGVRKKRCIVQKLDFENCIVTNIKTTARGRKKLRARITREFEHFTDVPEQLRKESSSSSPTSFQTLQPSSPVLLKKQPRDIGSPVFTKQKKTPRSKEWDERQTEHSTIEEISSSPGSPVFKTFKKQKFTNRSQNPIIRTVSSQQSSSSDLPSSFQIEEFTQESKQSFKISSVESPVGKTDDSSVYEPKPNKIPNSPPFNYVNIYEKYDSPKPVRRNYKKKSLLGRLQKLHQKQASEKLLWQHQNRKSSTNCLTLSIISFWSEEFNYFLKCESFDSETVFLIVDCRWIPNVKNVREGSVLQLHPPWQKISTEGSAMSVFLSIVCLNILEETKTPIPAKEVFESVSTNRFIANRKLFFDSLFSSCGSGFWF